MTERRTSLARHIRDVRPMVQGKIDVASREFKCLATLLAPHATPPHPTQTPGIADGKVKSIMSTT